MESVRRNRERVAMVSAFVLPLGAAGVLYPLRGTFASTAAALAMVAVIAVVAVIGDRPAGVIASASAAVWFDVFLTRPYLRLTVSHRPDLETTIAILVVGVFITELAGRSRLHWRAASDAAQFVAMIHDVADMAARQAPTSSITREASNFLTRILDLRACRFDATLVDPPLARIEPNGEVAHVGLRWPALEIGIPGPEAEIVAQWRGHVVGRFVLTPTRGQAVSLERRLVAVSLVDVVAASVSDEHLAN